ncbi:MAG: TMEM175 family protein [Ferruginibacter sp.]
MIKGRLEAFSDGVIAIIITIMVLELRAPEGGELESLKPIIPKFLSYILSFIYLGIYWNNHHHMLHAVKEINGASLWANLHLLFWLSLIPFTTAWMGENHFTKWPVALYGVVLFMDAIAYTILSAILIHNHEKNNKLAKAIGKDGKGKLSLLLYAVGVALAFINQSISLAIYAIVAMIWIIPDKRIERTLLKEDN